MANNLKNAAEGARNLITNFLNNWPVVKEESKPDLGKKSPKSNDSPKVSVKVNDPNVKKPVDAPKENPKPMPVKINNSDILMEGPVRAFVKDQHQWIDAKLKLTVDGKLTKDDQVIELSPLDSIGPSRIVNVAGAFNLDNYHESDWHPGNLFAAGVVADGEKWLRCLNYVRYHKIIAAKHDHPLDEITREEPCRICKKEPTKSTWRGDGFACMFCKAGEYEICNECQPRLEQFPKDLLITTPHHPHKLMAFDSPRKLHPFSAAEKHLPCNNCGKNITGRMYYCPRCDYAECVPCATPSSSGSDAAIGSAPMQLDVKDLKDYLKNDKPNHYKLSVQKGQRIPNRVALVSNRSWDLSKIDTCQPLDAYFEVTFANIPQEDVHVTVGIGNQIFQQNKFLGDQQNSFGYWNSGTMSVNSVYDSEEDNDKYNNGDVVGVGILLDSFNEQKVFYTKNGQFVKSFGKKVHRGMDCFPGLSFSTYESEIEFTVNFTGPFKFDVKSLPDYRNDRSCRFGAAPIEIVAQIFYWAAETPMQAAEWRTLSKQMNETASHNIVWKDLYLKKFKNQNKNLKIKSWMNFYKRRQAAKKEKLQGLFMAGSKPSIIENCDFEFECPLIFENLEQKDEDKYQERHCNKCNKTVYQVYGEDQLKEYITMGRCVTMYSSRNGDIGMPIMGSAPAPRLPVPNPFNDDRTFPAPISIDDDLYYYFY